MFFLAYILATAFVVTPPTPYVITHPDGVVAHVDYPDNPCGTRGPEAGCSQMVEGVQHIWHSGVAPGHVVQHERDHDKMAHGPWYLHRYFGNCAEILTDSEKYPRGGLICHNAGKRERIVPAGYHDEECQECLFSDYAPGSPLGVRK